MKKKQTHLDFKGQHTQKNWLFLIVMALATFLVVPVHAEDYGLKICGVQVTDENCEDLSVIEGVKSGSIAYYPYTKQLLIKELVIDTKDGSCIYNESIEGLTIEVSGECNLKSTFGNCMMLDASTTLKKRIYWQGTSSLNLSSVNFVGLVTLTGECNISDLNLSATGEYGIVGNNNSLSITNSTVHAKGLYGSIKDFKSFTLNDVKIIEPEDVVFEDGALKKNGETVTEEVVIIPYEKYGLRICGVQISDGNNNDLSNIEGVKSGTVTYNSQTKTLRLTNAVIESETNCIINDSITGLTIEVEGECKMTSSKWTCFYLNDTTSFVSIGTGSSLTLNSPNKAAVGVGKNTLCSIYTLNLNTNGKRGFQGDDGTSSTLYIYYSFVKINGTGGTIYNFDSVKMDCCGIEDGNFSKGTLIHNGKEVTGEVMIQPIYYTLKICSVKITEENKNNLSSIPGVKSGTITYDTKTKTLRLKDVDICNTENEGTCIINENVKGLTIELEGECKMTSDWWAMIINGSTTITNKTDTEFPSLNVASSEKSGIYVSTNAVLTISNIDLTATGIYGITGYKIDGFLNIKNSNVRAQGSKGNICAFKSITLEDCEVITPKGATFVDGYLRLNGQIVTDPVVIGNTTVGIETMTDKVSRGEAIYTIDGVRINTPFNNLPRGIYIVNGHKVVKK